MLWTIQYTSVVLSTMEQHSIVYSPHALCAKTWTEKNVLLITHTTGFTTTVVVLALHWAGKLLSCRQADDLDGRRCSCDFPETDLDCEALLAANDPTTPAPTAIIKGNVDEAKDGDEKISTWVIVITIAMLVLVVLVAYGAVVWRKMREQRGLKQGVDGFV